jgi:hypothetical protein
MEHDARVVHRGSHYQQQQIQQQNSLACRQRFRKQ